MSRKDDSQLIAMRDTRSTIMNRRGVVAQALPSLTGRKRVGTATVIVLVVLSTAVGAQNQVVTAEPPLVLVHYMPWFEARPRSGLWGWHWTMNFFDPNSIVDGRRSIASHYYPLIGPYDSGDVDVLEYHVLLMKMAGIDGVIIDWYGLQDFRDYKLLHKNTLALVKVLAKHRLKFAVCYEDQTIPALVTEGRLKEPDRVSHATREIQWMAENWFCSDSYVRIGEDPVLLSFGQNGLTDQEWTSCLGKLDVRIAYFSEHHRRTKAFGAYDWPVPSEGFAATKRFLAESKAWSKSIPVAYPRFADVYAKAGVHESWGRIEDDQGTTFQKSMSWAIKSRAQVIQVATWNDWGEGTMIEPSREFQFRDLQMLQDLRRRHLDPSFKHRLSELGLPGRLFKLRKQLKDSASALQLDRIADLMSKGMTIEARAELATISKDDSR